MALRLKNRVAVFECVTDPIMFETGCRVVLVALDGLFELDGPEVPYSILAYFGVDKHQSASCHLSGF